MKALTMLAAMCIVLGAGIVSNTFGQPPKPGDYHGDVKSLSEFILKYSLRNWPLPSAIDYFDPKGTTAQTLRYAHWIPTQANRVGVVVYFNGRTEFIERNMPTYRDLLQRGFEVWSLDWRGQGFSQRQLSDKQKHSIDAFETYVSDASYFVKNVVKLDQKQGKKVLLAHSMGGQIALRFLLEERNARTFDFAVLSSPLLRIPEDSWYLRLDNKLKISTGFGDSCIIGRQETWSSNFETNDSCQIIKGSFSAKPVDLEKVQKYSHDVRKLAEINCLVESSRDANGKAKPDLRVACPTNNWLHAAFESTDAVMRQAERLVTPTLIVRAMPDTAVDNAGQSEFCAKAKIRCEDIGVVKGTQTGHEILNELQPIRSMFFMHFDKFVGLQK